MLYDFLVPYCTSSLKALEEAVKAYVVEPNTYLGALNEAVSDAAMLFRTVEKMLLNLPAAWMQLVSILFLAGYSVEEISKECSSPNSFKCRSMQKRERLDWAAELLRLLPDVFLIANQNGYWLFSSGRGCKLLRTHSRECKLF